MRERRVVKRLRAVRVGRAGSRAGFSGDARDLWRAVRRGWSVAAAGSGLARRCGRFVPKAAGAACGLSVHAKLKELLALSAPSVV